MHASFSGTDRFTCLSIRYAPAPSPASGELRREASRATDRYVVAQTVGAKQLQLAPVKRGAPVAGSTPQWMDETPGKSLKASPHPCTSRVSVRPMRSHGCPRSIPRSAAVFQTTVPPLDVFHGNAGVRLLEACILYIVGETGWMRRYRCRTAGPTVDGRVRDGRRAEEDAG